MQDLSLNVLDIAENSVKAKATEIKISVLENGDSLEIIIEDNGCGMSEETVKNVVDPFYTTRTTRKVGLGVPFFKMSAEQTGGSFLISSEIGVGTRVSAKYDMSHIDMMPVGDMEETVLSLVTLNTHIDFLYVRSKNGNTFEFSTKEIKEILGDVPLNEPEIVVFLRDYLKQHTEIL